MISLKSVLRWIPAIMVMTVIFMLSSLPASKVPTFGTYDIYVKKIGHAIGYGLLGVTYYYALPAGLPRILRWPMALSLSLGFALSDELHQFYVTGRTSSMRDVAIDGVGAFLALFLGAGYSASLNSTPRSERLPNSGLD